MLMRGDTDEKNYFSNGIFWNHIILRFSRRWLGHWGYRNARVVIVVRLPPDRGTISSKGAENAAAYPKGISASGKLPCITAHKKNPPAKQTDFFFYTYFKLIMLLS